MAKFVECGVRHPYVDDDKVVCTHKDGRGHDGLHQADPPYDDPWFFQDLTNEEKRRTALAAELDRQAELRHRAKEVMGPFVPGER